MLSGDKMREKFFKCERKLDLMVSYSLYYYYKKVLYKLNPYLASLHSSLVRVLDHLGPRSENDDCFKIKL